MQLLNVLTAFVFVLFFVRAFSFLYLRLSLLLKISNRPGLYWGMLRPVAVLMFYSKMFRRLIILDILFKLK